MASNNPYGLSLPTWTWLRTTKTPAITLGWVGLALMGGHEMTAMELYELLNKAEIEYEVIEIFEGARFIRVEVEEEEELK
jgi:hypothetical protein